MKENDKQRPEGERVAAVGDQVTSTHSYCEFE